MRAEEDTQFAQWEKDFGENKKRTSLRTARYADGFSY